MEVTVIPVGTKTTSLSGYVAEIQEMLEQAPESIRFQLTPMSTIIEGDLQDLLQVVRRMHELPFQNGAGRVCTSIKIDDRRDLAASMEQKLESVRNKRNRTQPTPE